jgi:oligosaccharide repeat unit polymerase
MFLYMYKQGFFSDLFNGRSYAMGNIDARPIYNLFFSALSLYLLVCMAYIYRKKSKFIIFIAAISTFYALTSGTRGAIMTAILTIIYVYYNINKKASYLKLVMVGLSLIILAIYLGDVRLGQYNLLISMSNAVNGIIFGNNFSDLRDFAWVYSDWNKHFLYGKTFFSGLMSFIPSSMLPWRQQWGLGVFTVETIGYDTSVHPGLRPGIFGESYFNFGILGVCVFGFLYGYAIKRIDNFVRKSIKNESDKNKLVVKVTTGYIVANMAFNFMITAGFFTVYVYLLILIFGYIKFLLRKKFNKTNPPKKIRITW